MKKAPEMGEGSSKTIMAKLRLFLCLRRGIVDVYFEGVCVNYRHPAPRRGLPRVCSTRMDAFWLDPVDRLDPLQNSGTLILKHPSRSFGTFSRKIGTHFDPNLQKSNENLDF